MNRLSRIKNSNTAFFLFTLCWIAYFTAYIGRLNYSSAMSDMIQDRILTQSHAGFISMLYFFSYGCGQFFNGILGDRFSPHKMIFIGLFLAAGMNFMMPLVSLYPTMAAVWGINGYAQAMIWPPIIRIFSEMLDSHKKLKYSIDIVSSQAAGTLVSYLLSAIMLHFFGWKAVFFSASLLLFLVSLIWICGFSKIRKKMKPVSSERNISDSPQHVPFFQLLKSSGMMIILFPIMVHGMLKDGVTTWVPTYISENFLTSPSFSVMITTLLPIFNLAGAYLARYIYQKCQSNETRAASVFFGLSTLSLFILRICGHISIFLTAVLFALTTTSMMAINTLYVSIYPLRYEKQGRVATVSGFLNATAYMGTAVSTFAIGMLAEHTSWNITVTIWVFFTVIALIFCFASQNITE